MGQKSDVGLGLPDGIPLPDSVGDVSPTPRDEPIPLPVDLPLPDEIVVDDPPGNVDFWLAPPPPPEQLNEYILVPVIFGNSIFIKVYSLINQGKG